MELMLLADPDSPKNISAPIHSKLEVPEMSTMCSWAYNRAALNSTPVENPSPGPQEACLAMRIPAVDCPSHALSSWCGLQLCFDDAFFFCVLALHLSHK